MIPYLLLCIFLSQLLGIDVSLAPGLSAKNLLLYVTFVVIAIETAVTRTRKLELMSVLVPCVMFSSYAILSWLVTLLVIDYPAYDFLDSLIALKGGPVEAFLVLLIFFYGVNDEQQALWLLRRILWSIILANIFTVIDSLDIPDLGYMSLDDGRVAGYTGNATSFGALLVCFLPAIIVTFRTTTAILKPLAAIGLFASCLALVLTVSRSAFVGLGFAGLFGAFYLRTIIPPHVIVRAGLAALLVGIVVIIGAIAAGSGDLLLDRFGALGSNSFDATSGRNVIWGRLLGRMIEHPITFVTGFGWYAYETSDYYGINTHNTYLTFLYNLGVIGLVLYGALATNIIRVARAVLDRAGPDATQWIMALTFGFTGLSISLFFLNFFSWLYVWAYVGVSLRLAISQTGHEPAVVEGRARHVAASLDSGATTQAVGHRHDGRDSRIRDS